MSSMLPNGEETKWKIDLCIFHKQIFQFFISNCLMRRIFLTLDTFYLHRNCDQHSFFKKQLYFIGHFAKRWADSCMNLRIGHDIVFSCVNFISCLCEITRKILTVNSTHTHTHNRRPSLDYGWQLANRPTHKCNKQINLHSAAIKFIQYDK